MNVRESLAEALKQAMRARDTRRVATLRLILAAIKDREIAARGDDGADGVGDMAIRALLAQMVRQREESARAYEEGGRLELAEQEQAEIAIIREFLPRPLSDAEIQAAINQAINETGAESIRDMGRVMAALKARYAGQLDFAKAGPVVRHALS